MRRRPPLTMIVGLLLIVSCEALLFIDVQRRAAGATVVPLPAGVKLPRFEGNLQHAARLAAFNITPICWLGYLLTFDGLLTWLGWLRSQKRLSPIRGRPNRFAIAWLTSIPVWCWFDWINFRFLHAWRYHGMPPEFADRVLGYFIAFAAISP